MEQTSISPNCGRAHWRASSSDLLGYGDPAGLLDLRRAIAAYLRLSRGVRCDAEQIVIVGGSQQGLDLVARLLLERAGVLDRKELKGSGEPEDRRQKVIEVVRYRPGAGPVLILNPDVRLEPEADLEPLIQEFVVTRALVWKVNLFRSRE